MQSIKSGFPSGIPKQYTDLIETDPWLIAGDLKKIPHSEFIIAGLYMAFTSLKAEFSYKFDPRGPWTLRKQKKILSDGFVLVGDCDGFAVECIRRCKDLDISAQSMRLLVCTTKNFQSHMVSCVETEKGAVVFDCRANELTDIDTLLKKGYSFRIASSPTGSWYQVLNRKE